MKEYFGLLREEIKKQYGTFGRFAEMLGVSRQTMSGLLTGKADWSRELIVKSAKLLGIQDEIQRYFF